MREVPHLVTTKLSVQLRSLTNKTQRKHTSFCVCCLIICNVVFTCVELSVSCVVLGLFVKGPEQGLWDCFCESFPTKSGCLLDFDMNLQWLLMVLKKGFAAQGPAEGLWEPDFSMVARYGCFSAVWLHVLLRCVSDALCV